MIKQKRFFLKIPLNKYYFSSNIQANKLLSLSEYVHSFINKDIFGYIRDTGLTLISDLTLNEEELFEKFSPTTRNEIRRSIKDGIVCSLLEDNDIYYKFFNDFASQKKINGISKSEIISYGNNLFIFQALESDKILAIHSLLVDKESSIALLLTSSNARFDNNKERSTISRANRHLHFYEFQFLNQMGIKKYDWGGIAKENDLEINPGLKGVNDFKLSFGGDVIDNVRYRSIPYYLLQKIAILFGFIHSNSERQKNDE